MATLKQLEEQREELLARLADGDAQAEAALERLDAAIRSRLLKIQHSQQRLKAVKNAVSKGVPVEQAKSDRPAAAGRGKRRRPINRFD